MLKQDSASLSEFSWHESLMKCMQLPSSNIEPVQDKITVNHQPREEELDYHLNTEINWQLTVCCWRVPLKISVFPCRCSSNGHQASCLYERQSHSKLPTLTCSTCFTSLQVPTVEQRKTFKIHNSEGSPMRTLWREEIMPRIPKQRWKQKRLEMVVIFALLPFSTSNSTCSCFKLYLESD